MLFIRYIFLLLLLLSTNNNVCMTIKEIKKSSSTLQQLCITAIRKIVTAGDINDLVKKENFEKYSNLPESLKNKIARVPMFFKLGHEFVYKVPKSGRFDCIYLDEVNNHVHLKSKNKKKLTLFKMGEKEEIKSFKIPNTCQMIHKRSLICWSEFWPTILNDTSKIHFLKNGSEYTTIDLSHQYGFPYKIFNNQRILLFGTQGIINENLFDLDTKSFLIKEDNIKRIQFDANEKLCLIKNNNEIFTLYNMQGSAKFEKIQTFNNINNAVINPNGKNIIISTQDNKCALISIEGKILFEIEDGTHVQCACFNDTGDYVIVLHYNQENGLQYNIINTNNGFICFSLKLPTYSEVNFYKKFLIVIIENTAYLIRVKDLPKINNRLYALDDIKKCNKVYSFENVDNMYCRNNKDKSCLFHPSGDYIITRKDKLLKLIHIKSQECVATLKNVLSYHFSEPTGKMLYIEDGDGRWYKVFHCRNDFTLEEVILNRFITENNKYKSVFSEFFFSRNLEQNL